MQELERLYAAAVIKPVPIEHWVDRKFEITE
jgi:hypothetical protein